MTGYFMNSFCWPDAQSAIDSYSSHFPQVFSGSIVSLHSAPTISLVSGYPAITASYLVRNISNGTYTEISFFSYLLQCDPVAVNQNLLAQSISAFDPVAAAAYWMFAITFVFGCYLLAKSSGLIIQAVKRF